MSVCSNCKYYAQCGDDTRTQPCVGWRRTTNTTRRQSSYERTKAQVYATGNKWAIENFHATHD